MIGIKGHQSRNRNEHTTVGKIKYRKNIWSYMVGVEKDKKILYQLKNFFGCGNVYFQKDNRPNHQNCYRYEVFRWNDLEKTIIPFFKKNKLKLESKRKDFRLFCQLFSRIIKKEHHKELGLRKLYKIKQLMH